MATRIPGVGLWTRCLESLINIAYEQPLESDSLRKKKTLRLKLLKGSLGPQKGHEEATNGLMCRRRQITRSVLVLNHSSYRDTEGISATSVVT